MLSWVFIVLAHWNNSLWVDMSHHLDTLFWFLSQPVFALSPYCCVLRGEATNTNFYSLWFDPTRAPTYDLLHSRIAVNHYATDVVTTDGSRGPLPTSSVNVAIRPPKSRGITGQFIISVVVFFLRYTAHPMVMISLEICRKWSETPIILYIL